MLLTTVAMPVFSKKNETVSDRSNRGQEGLGLGTAGWHL
jgi:hypothetical protein